jgi:glycosyltransferase involved in cell wall biosynthesis
LRNLREKLAELKPDVLHAHDVYLYGYMGALCSFHPLVLSAWGSDVLAKPKESLEARNRVAFALRQADVVATTADFLGGYLSREFGIASDRIERIRWGIDLNVFRRGYEDQVSQLRASLGLDDQDPVILSNRNLTPHYAIEAVIDAVPLVLNRCPQAQFVFLRGGGSEEYEREIRSRAARWDVMGNVRFVSRLLNPEEMAVHTNMARATVSLARTDQFGASIMESMACGAIPIVSALDVYKQYLQDGDNAFFVDRDDPADVAGKIIYCIDHSELQPLFHQKNRAIIAENEDWGRNAQEMVRLYRRLGPGRS